MTSPNDEYQATAHKEEVRQYWERQPCGSRDEVAPVGTPDFFRSSESRRTKRDPFMEDIVRFEDWRGKAVLEVGCGMGMDTARFSRAGADVSAVDLTRAGVALTRARLDSEGLDGVVCRADAEALPFADATFDLVYSWGVIHHTPHTEVAASEIHRVCKRGGRVLVMVYSRWSLVALQAWLRYGLFEGHPLRSPARLISEGLESPGTKTYSRREASSLFPDMDQVSARTVVTTWDLRLGRRRFLPAWTRRVIPSGLGWFLVLDGTKA